MARNVGYLSLGHGTTSRTARRSGTRSATTSASRPVRPSSNISRLRPRTARPARVIPPILDQVTMAPTEVGIDASTPSMFWIMNADNDFVGNKAALLADDPAYAPEREAWDRKLRDVQEWLVEPVAGAPRSRRSIGRHDHVSRVVSPGARAEGLAPAACAAEAAARRDAHGAARVVLVLRQRRHLRADTTRTGRSAAQAKGGEHQDDRRDDCRDGQSRLSSADCAGAEGIAANVQVVHPVSLLAEGYRQESRQ